MADDILNIITEKVLKLMDERNLTAYRVCVDNDIPTSSFSQIKQGKFNWRIEWLIKLSKYFDVPLGYFIDESEHAKLEPEFSQYVSENPPVHFMRRRIVREIPIVGSVGCGTPLKAWENYGDRFLSLPEMEQFADPFILIAKGESMRPYINPGDYIICADAPERIKDGRAVVVSFVTEPETSDGNAKLIKFLDSDMIMLYSVNTKFEPTIHHKSEIHKIYKIVRLIRDVK